MVVVWETDLSLKNLCSSISFLHHPPPHPTHPEDQKDIFDFCSLLKDWWEDATVTGEICHQEEKVTIGNLLHHKYPAAKREAGPWNPWKA